METKDGTSSYRSALRALVRGLWAGIIDFDQFYENMLVETRRFTTRAWHEGAQLCGILPSELTAEERARLEQAIQYEQQWIAGFGEAIEEGSKANGGLLGPLYSRAEIWIGRYIGARDEAKAAACADKKLMWVYGDTGAHCSSCAKLNGKIKRGSYWHEQGILPRVHDAHYLECGGWRCQCTLEETDERCSPGPLPGLP